MMEKNVKSEKDQKSYTKILIFRSKLSFFLHVILHFRRIRINYFSCTETIFRVTSTMIFHGVQTRYAAGYDTEPYSISRDKCLQRSRIERDAQGRNFESFAKFKYMQNTPGGHHSRTYR